MWTMRILNASYYVRDVDYILIKLMCLVYVLNNALVVIKHVDMNSET